MSSFGEKLKREREDRHITLREIAESTKISVNYLQALESDDFGRLPGGVFDRGYVRSYAQVVGLDPDALVDEFVRARQSGTAEDQSANLEALRQTVDRSPLTGGATIRVRGVLIVSTLLAATAIAVAAWAYFRTGGPDEQRREPPRQTAVPGENRPVPSHEEARPVPAVRAPETQPAAELAEVVVAKTTQDPPETAAPPPGAPRPGSPPPSRPTPSKAPVPAGAAAGNRFILARVVIDRAVSGSLNCDNRQVEMLDGLRPGTVLDLECHRFLLIDSDDGGGLRLGLAGADPVTLAADGKPLRNHAIYP